MARAESITFEKFRTRFSTEDDLPGGIIPASVSERLRLPEMWVYGILPGSRAKHVPVPRLPASNVRHGRDGHAPHASAADRLVLGDLSLCHGQTRHFCRPAESYAEHLLWVGVASFARKMARLCSRGCRLLKMSPAARSSRSLTKLLRRAQRSNATAQSPKNRQSDLHASDKSRRHILRSAALSRH